MEPIDYATASGDEELEQVLTLQRRNVEEALSPEEAARDGFVTLRHDLELLREMSDAAPSIVAKADGRVVGYALVMLRGFEDRFPVLAPMVALLDELTHRGQRLADTRHFVMGQVCIDRPWRGRGVFAGLFERMRAEYADRFDLVVTELATRNTRSARAHAKAGFELLHRYRDPTGESWDLVAWDWHEQA